MNDGFPAGLLAGPLIFLFLMASVWAWWGALSRLSQRQVLLEYEPRRAAPWGFLDLLIAFFLLLTCLSCTSWLLANKFGVDVRINLAELPADARGAVILGAALYTLTTFLLSVTAVRLRTGATLTDFGIDLAHVRADLWLGVIAFVMLAPVVYGIQMVLVQLVESKHPLVELLREHPDPKFFLVSVVAAVIVAPLAEEYFFRVLLQGWLQRAVTTRGSLTEILLGGRTTSPPGEHPAEVREDLPLENSEPVPLKQASVYAEDNPYQAPHAGRSDAEPISDPRTKPAGARWAIFVPAVLFALAHATHGPDPIPLFVLAVGLGYLYQQTHRILPCIVVHLLLNASSLAVLWLVVYFGK